MILLYISLAWILGIITGSAMRIPIWAISFCLIPLLIIPLIPKYWKGLCFIAAVIITLVAAGIYSHNSLAQANYKVMQFYNNKGEVTIEGIIENDPEIRDRTTSFKVAAKSIRANSEIREISGSVLVKALTYDDFHYGDVLRIEGELETPQNFSSFDYQGYLANRDIYSVMNFPSIEILERGQGIKPIQWIYAIRKEFSKSINAALPEPQASLANGIFLGITGAIPSDLREAFTRTGTSHILAISGMNLTIVIGILLGLGIWIFGRQYSIYIWLSLAIIWIYTILTGMRPPIIRSAIMGSMFLFAELLGRQKSAVVALVFAAAIMIGFAPRITGDAGFQLSFLSMCGLIFIHPLLRKILIPDKPPNLSQNFFKKTIYFIFDSFLVTLSALIPTWPVIAYHFNIISIFGLPATIFILPVLPGIILITAFISIIGLFSPVLAQIIGWLDWLLLNYYTLIVKIFSIIPLSSVKLGSISIWQLSLYYAILILIWFAIEQHNKTVKFVEMAWIKLRSILESIYCNIIKLPLKWIAICLLIINILIWIAIFNLPDGKLHISILDVGQGDAILIQTPEGKKILIDAGPSSQNLKLQLGKKLPFWDRHVELAIFTQPQADHISGFDGMLKTYSIGKFIYTPTPSNSVLYRQLMTTIEEMEIAHSSVYYPQKIYLSPGIDLEVMHPSENLLDCQANSTDCNGLVLRLDYKQVSFLFAADIDAQAEQYLIQQRANLNCTVLKVAHHGSKTSSTSEFLAIANPCAAVISAGKDNAYGHPHPDTLSRIYEHIEKEQVFITANDGAIEFISDGSRLWVKREG